MRNLCREAVRVLCSFRLSPACCSRRGEKKKKRLLSEREESEEAESEGLRFVLG